MAHADTRYGDRIVCDPEILVGKPTVRGTRIPVELVIAKLARNPDPSELFEDYPGSPLRMSRRAWNTPSPWLSALVGAAPPDAALALPSIPLFAR